MLVIPGDPYTISGSRGDDAMLRVVRLEARRKWAKVDLFMLTSESATSETEAIALGYIPIKKFPRFFENVAAICFLPFAKYQNSFS